MKLRIVIVVFFCIVGCAAGQQSTPQPNGTSTPPPSTPSSQTGSGDPSGSPIDVPDIIIKGSATLKLVATSFSKQTPKNTRVLTKAELDSLNSLEKQSPQFIPRSSAPAVLSAPLSYNGFISAAIGLHQTPDASLSYATTLSGYHLFGQLDYASSNGYIAQTDFSTLGVLLQARYHAPMQYGLFGGSLTTTALRLSSRSYSFFAVPDSAPRRNTQSILARIDVVNDQYSLPYSASLSLGTMSIHDKSGQNTDIREDKLQAALELHTKIGNITALGYVDLDIRPFKSATMSDNQLGIGTQVGDSATRLIARLGMRGGQTSLATSFFAVQASIATYLRPWSNWTLTANVQTGAKNNFFSDIVACNPYLSSSSDLKSTRHTIGFNASASYRPTTRLELKAEAGFDRYSEAGVHALDSTREFREVYVPYSLTHVGLDGSWEDSPHSALTVSVQLQSAQLENSVAVPYVTPLIISTRYHRRLMSALDIDLSLSYISSRNVSLQKESLLSAYTVLNARVQYALTSELAVFARVENMMNSSIFVYELYRERDAFASIGLQWKF